MMDGKALGKQMLDAVKGYVARAILPVHASLEDLQRKLAEQPTPKDGVNGNDGAPGKDGADGKDGASGIDGKDGERGERGKDGADGRDGIDGVAGIPGRDALDINVLDEIDEAKVYPRGTFAVYKGGMIRASRKTDPIVESLDASGWKVCCNGIADESYEILDEGRLIRRTVTHTNGRKAVTELQTAAMVYREIWSAEKEYGRGDVVTRGGCAYHCQISGTKQLPGTTGANDWKMMVKAGRDGKAGEPGKQGPEGRPGKDRSY